MAVPGKLMLICKESSRGGERRRKKRGGGKNKGKGKRREKEGKVLTEFSTHSFFFLSTLINFKKKEGTAEGTGKRREGKGEKKNKRGKEEKERRTLLRPNPLPCA